MKTLKLNIILAVAAMVSAIRGLRLAANNYDAAVEVHDDTVRRTNDVAITARHLLWTQGSTDNGIALCSATTLPLGTVDNTETATGMSQTVKLLGKGPTKKMVAGAAITAGARVYTGSGGNVQPTFGGTFFQVGIALTAAAADNDIIEVADCAAVKTNS